MNEQGVTEDNIKREEAGSGEGHPVATGVGALSGGAAGAAIGTAVGGPIGMVIGAVVGAVAGGAGGYAVGEAIDPVAEDSYWRDNHYKQPFAKGGNFDEYQEGYRTGYQGFERHGGGQRSFEEAETDLQRDYGTASGLSWDKARDASRAAWSRAERGEAVRAPAREGEETAGEMRTERADTTRGTVATDRFNEGDIRLPVNRGESLPGGSRREETELNPKADSELDR